MMGRVGGPLMPDQQDQHNQDNQLDYDYREGNDGLFER